MKDLKISKELIKNVFNYDIDGFQIVGTDKITQLRVWKKGCEFHLYDTWDIHHFAFKCKEWASNLGYQIISGLSDEQAYREDYEQAYSAVFWHEGDDLHRTYKNELFLACSEQDAIIKACEWVIKEQNNDTK